MSNQIIRLRTVEDFLKYSSFFMEGFEVLSSKPEIKLLETSTQFTQTVLEACCSGEHTGYVNLLLSSKEEPLAFMVTTNTTMRFRPRTAFVYCVYSNNKCLTAPVDLFASVLKWAKNEGYEEIQAASRRITGAHKRWVKTKFNLEPHAIIYRRVL